MTPFENNVNAIVGSLLAAVKENLEIRTRILKAASVSGVSCTKAKRSAAIGPIHLLGGSAPPSPKGFR